MKLKGSLIKYRLGTWADAHVGVLEAKDNDGNWMVRNSRDNKLYVLRQTPGSEPVASRRAHFVFCDEKTKNQYIKTGQSVHAHVDKEVKEYVPVTKKPSQSLNVGDQINESLKGMLS